MAHIPYHVKKCLAVILGNFKKRYELLVRPSFGL